jgi:gamma-glutamyltranspeptidase/glutathione hydrolase
MVQSHLGVVASESVLASQVGARILEQGGNAVDAAIAMNAMMGLVAPMNDGIGGDLFAIYYEAKTGRLYGLNASGWAPKALTAEYLRAKGNTRMPQRGIDAATVPGAVKGWEALRMRFGRLSFGQILAPAIQYAETGFPVGEVVSVYWKDSENVLRADPATAKTFLPGGKLPEVGDMFRNPELAWTYRQIAAQGAKAFYTGNVAAKLLASSKTHGGTMTAADLAEYEVEWVTPISTTYRGWTVYELPPNGQGIAALMMLNIMEQFDLKAMGHNSVQALHHIIEAKKLAYADMQRYDADPRFATVPVSGLISKTYRGAREADQRLSGQLQRACGDAGRHGQRHDLSECGGQGGEPDLLHPEQLQHGGLWRGPDGGRRRVRLAQPWRWVLPRRGEPQSHRRPQATAAHDHSRLHGEG